METNFDWIKLHKDYPKAYAYMEENFECLFTETWRKVKGGVVIEKIKHPLKRDLYDFFDKENIVIVIDMDSECFCFSIHNDNSDIESFDTRSLTETHAFIKAFQILNKRLNK